MRDGRDREGERGRDGWVGEREEERKKKID